MKYEKGKWYASHRHDMLSIYRFDYLDGQRLIYSEGYDQNGIRQFCFGGLKQSQIVGLATPDQIDQCLKAYAEKNGYVEGVKVKCILGTDKVLTLGDKYTYWIEEDYMCSVGWTIYDQGKWAEIVKGPDVTDKLTFCSGGPNQIVRGKIVSIQELIEGYQKYLDIKTIIG